MPNWKDRVEDLWQDVKDRGYYIVGVTILILAPFIVAAPAAKLPEPFSLLNPIYTGSKLPVLSDIYAIGRDAGFFGPNSYVLDVLALCAIWAIFAASWDLLSGYTGQISFGHAVFWGFAAYCSYWFSSGLKVGLLSNILGPEYILDPLTAMFLSAIIVALFALCIGVIALRVKGPYLALVTLILPLIAKEIPYILLKFDIVGLEGEIFGISYSLVIFRDISTGGDYGLLNPTRIIPFVGDLPAEVDSLNFYLFSIVVLFVAVGIMMLIAFSRLGLAFQSIREDEGAAASLGINVRFYKLLSFVASAFFAGIAGTLYAQHPWTASTGPSIFGTDVSFKVIIMCVIGGIGSITGGVVGAFLLTILLKLYMEDAFSDVYALEILALGLLLIVILRYMRFGLVRATKEQKRACVLGILFALSWAITASIMAIDPNQLFDSIVRGDFKQFSEDFGGIFDNLRDFQETEDILIFVSVLIMLIFTIPAIPVFLIGEIIGFFVLEDVLGMSFTGFALPKAKFLIYLSSSIPYAYYLPKVFKKARLRYWGVWPSVGRYEPD